MIEETLADAEDRMKKAVGALKRELATIRTGRAQPSLVDHVRVDYYGTPTPLNQLATVSAPEARLLTIQPWDRQSLGTIEKAIQKSDLGLNPTNDGQIIRLVIPQLTEERRKELVKLVHRRVEEGRVAVRNVRRDCLEQLRRLEKEKEISEDDDRRAQERLQKLTDQFVKDIDGLGHEKEEELLEV
jgi:ribosome recycling factor